MEEEPPQPPPSDLSDAATPQPTDAESGEEKLQSVPQCEEVDGRQSIQSMDESATEDPDRPTEESEVPNPQCSQSDDGGERRSAADEEEGEEYMPAVEEEEKPQVDGSDERLSSLREEKLVEEVEKASSLKEEEEEEKVLTSEPGAAVDEFMQENVEEKISDVAGPCPTEELDRERPQLAEINEKVYSLKEEEEEEEASISETAVDEVMPENLEEKPHQPEELNGERHQSAEGDSQGYSLQQALLENEEHSSSLEEGLYGKEEEKIPVSDDIMQESVEEKLPAFGGMKPAEQLDEKMPQSTEKDEKVSSLQEEFVGEEEKVPLSQLSGFIADVDESMHENVEGKLSEEQLNEEKPQSVRKGKKMSSSRRGLEEEDEKVSSLQEKYAEKDEKVSTVQEESDDKEESDEKEEAEEMDMDEGGPAMAAGRRTGSKRKRGRPPVAQGRKARAPPKPKEEEEELCFICFDGGDLVVCDHRGCPKVYHPSCVNRDEAYFKAKGQWSCGWHICSNCQKSARHMCYTCTYSVCKRCIKEAEFVCVRGNRGFCEACMKTVMQIEMNKADETTDVVDFDDKASWMYLFKDYWIDLKAKLSLTTEELTGARNPLKETNATSGNEEPLDKKRVTQWNKESSENPGNASDDQGGCSSSSLRCYKERASSRKKVKKRPRNMANKEHLVKGAGAIRSSISEDVEWASEELLEFVAHMKDGDSSIRSQFDVQALLLEYIKQNNLRDPRRKSQVICDSRLQALFGKSRVGHLEMLKLLEPHFLIKEASPLVADDNQGGVVDPDPSQTEAEGNSSASTKMNLDTRRKPRRRVEEKGLINLDDYAAIDVHNVSHMYLRRNLMEDFLDDIDMFNENVVGSFIRIRISGSASNKDMYRLVQVVGTGKAAEKYTTGKKTTDITLEVLNLNKREFLTIDLISNQEFTEEECKRLRQSVKCGFIDRLTAAEVQEKAQVLHTVKVNDWLESEKLRLGHLRDRASEKGRKKEHRECVEKLQLLSTPEERNRRLNEVPEIHVDPNMAPDYDSTEDEDDLNAKRQDNNKMPKSSFKDRDEFSARRGGSASWKNSDAVWNSSRSTSKPGVQDVVLPTVPADKTNGLSRNQENDGHQVTSPKTPKPEANATGVDTVLKNDQPVVEPGQSSGVRPELAPQPANVMSSNTSETEKTWHYQDPAGKIQGPFSMTQLRKWNSSKFFPTNLRIWRTSENQEDSILLTDALSGKFHKDLQQQEPQHSNSTQPTNVPAVVDSRVNSLADGMRGNNNQTTASFPAPGNYNSAKCDRWTTQPSSLSPNNTGVVSPMDRRPTTSSTGWESSKDSNAWSGHSQVCNSPRPVAPLSRNSSQQPSFQGRNDRGGNNGKWNGGRGRQNNWNSNKHRRFQTNGRGYERQHPYQSSSSQQFRGEQWKMRPANDSPNQLVSSSFNVPAHGPQPSSIDWASLQGALNRILPSSSIQPMSSGPSTIPRGSEVQQSPSNLTSPLMNSAGGWTSNSVPNVNPTKTEETVGVMSNFQQQNEPSESSALATSGNHALCSGSNTAEFVDSSNRKQRLESDNSNTTPNSEQASSDVLNSGSIQPANSQLNEAGDRGIPSNKLHSNKKCPEVPDKSASENKKIPVGGTGTEFGPASVAQNALGSSNIPDASVSVQRIGASSSKAQQCWPPASAQQQGPNNSSVNPNPAQPLSMGWGMAPLHPNLGTGTVQEIENMVYPAIPGAANMGWGMMAHGLVNMMWGTHANLNWVPPAQSPMNANLGWAIPQQGNANVNLALGAQPQANPNAGWVMPMQVNSAQNPGWVAPNVGNANPNPGWVAPTEGNANQNAAWGTLMQGTGQGNINNAANQNGGGGRTNSCGDGGSSHALPPAEQRGLCKFHENGHCEKGASCNYIYS